MSLAAPRNQQINDAAAAAVNTGLAMVVAIANSNVDASGFSPAPEPLVCTTGSTDINDAKSSFSNHGACMIPPSLFPSPSTP